MLYVGTTTTKILEICAKFQQLYFKFLLNKGKYSDRILNSNINNGIGHCCILVVPIHGCVLACTRIKNFLYQCYAISDLLINSQGQGILDVGTHTIGCAIYLFDVHINIFHDNHKYLDNSLNLFHD